jgi:hypothetical protein
MKFAQKIIICMVVIVVLIFPVNSIAHENSSRLLFADKGKHDDKGDREARERLRGEGKSERKHMKEERKAHKKAKKEARKEKRRHMKEEGQARREKKDKLVGKMIVMTRRMNMRFQRKKTQNESI